jgi:hypothetical protein
MPRNARARMASKHAASDAEARSEQLKLLLVSLRKEWRKNHRPSPSTTQADTVLRPEGGS